MGNVVAQRKGGFRSTHQIDHSLDRIRWPCRFSGYGNNVIPFVLGTQEGEKWVERRVVRCIGHSNNDLIQQRVEMAGQVHHQAKSCVVLLGHMFETGEFRNRGFCRRADRRIDRQG